MRRPPSISEFKRYPVTAGVALLAIAVTLAGFGQWKIDSLTEDYHILEGQYWRFFTSILPHGDPMHLIFNVYWLWVFGTLVEQVFGHWRTLRIILLFAFGSGAAEYAFLDGGIGLSGVGYGFFGMLWVLAYHDRRFFDAMDQSTIILFVIWFFLCVALTHANVWHIANIAHGAGAVFGAVTGMVIAMRGAERKRYIALLTGLLIAVAAGATVGRPYINMSSEGSMDYLSYGNDLLDKKQNQAAEVQYKNALRIDHHNALAWYNLGCAYQRQGKLDDAKHTFGRAYEIDPNDAQIKEAFTNWGTDSQGK